MEEASDEGEAEKPVPTPTAPGGRDAKPLRRGRDDPWTWDREERSAEVRLYGCDFRIAHFHPNWSSGTAGVRGTRLLNSAKYFWELHVSKRIFGTSMMFGIGTQHAPLHADSFTNLLGKDNHGWGLSHKGLLWHGGRWTHYTKPFRENKATKVGILFDGVAGTLAYYKDDEYLGVAFRGLHHVKKPLYPVVCSTAAKTEMFLGTTRKEFVSLQDRCCVVLAKIIRSKRDLEGLFVPIELRLHLIDAYEKIVQPLRPASRNASNGVGSVVGEGVNRFGPRV